MRIALILTLFLSPAVLAQGLEDLIGEALDPRTAPAKRTKDLDRIAKSNGLDRLAERGLDPSLDPEVIHAVVDALLQAEDIRPYLERIIRLLLVDAHREKVRQRLQAIGEHPERGAALVEECGRLARSSEPDVKRAAILALAEIPRRRALELILEVGQKDPKLRETARAHLEKWLGTDTLEESAAYLAGHPRDSFWDLVRRRVEGLMAELESRGKMAREFIGSAPLDEVLGLLEKGGESDTREAAAARVKELAAKNDIEGPDKVAKRVVAIFTRERALGAKADAATLANLLDTMRALTKGGAKAPLWKAIDRKQLLSEIEPLSRWTGVRAKRPLVGFAAVRLLAAADAEGKTLFYFARDFGQPEVRKEAIQYLGNLAGRVKGRGSYVGGALGRLLDRGETDAAVRAQILSTLRQPEVPVDKRALRAIEGYLAKGAKPPLANAEIIDCITILGQSGADDALAVLFQVSKEHPKPTVRRFAVEEGLLPRAQRETDPKKQQAILDHLVGLALATDQTDEARRAVIEGLGRKGTRFARPALDRIAKTKDLPEPLAAAAREAKLALAKRLATPQAGGALDREDLAAAVAILEEEWQRAPEKVAPLVDTVLRAGDGAKLPVGGARYFRARVYAKRQDKGREEKTLLGLYEEAARKAVADGLPADLHRRLLTEYLALLEGKTDAGSLQKRRQCTSDLATLYQETGDKTQAARLFIEAAAQSVDLKDTAAVQDLLNKAMATGGVAAGELAKKHQKLLAQLEKLKKPGNS